MSTEINVDEELTKILEKYFNTKDPNFTPETPLTDMGLDSLDLVELCMELEEVFDFSIPFEEEEKIKEGPATLTTLKDLVLRFFNEEVVPPTPEIN